MGDVFKREKRRERHQEVTEKKRRSSGAPTHAPRYFSFGTGVLGRLDGGDGFEQAVRLHERPNTLVVLVSVLNHLARFESEKDFINVVGVATEECARQHECLLRGACERSESIPLGGIAALEFMDLVGDGK